MSREAAEKVYALTGLTVEQRLAGIERDAAELLRRIRAGRRFTGADVRRWVADQMFGCAVVFCAPAPRSLVELNKILLNVSDNPRTARKNTEMFRKAAEYVAEYPDAGPGEIKRAIKYDQYKQIEKWMTDSKFQELVETERHIRAAKAAKSAKGY